MLAVKIQNLGLSVCLCSWISCFPTNSPQVERTGKHPLTQLILNSEGAIIDNQIVQILMIKQRYLYKNMI